MTGVICYNHKRTNGPIVTKSKELMVIKQYVSVQSTQSTECKYHRCRHISGVEKLIIVKFPDKLCV